MGEGFQRDMRTGYRLDEAAVVLGSPMRDGTLEPDVRVQVAPSVLNRHGLIAGATGTGKTKTLQSMVGRLSEQGVPCLVADVKGDLTGLAAPGEAGNAKIESRCPAVEVRHRRRPRERAGDAGGEEDGGDAGGRAAAGRDAHRRRPGGARERRQAERARREQERIRQRQVEMLMRTGTKILTSRGGQTVIRGIFSTLFGGGRR